MPKGYKARHSVTYNGHRWTVKNAYEGKLVLVRDIGGGVKTQVTIQASEVVKSDSKE